MNKRWSALLLLLAAIPAFAQHREPVASYMDANGKMIYLDYAANDLLTPDPQHNQIQKVVIFDFQCVPTPTNPPNGNVRFYCDSGTGQMACLTSTGANCLPGGGGGGGGPVTSVGLAGPTGIPITNSPVTGTGTLQWSMPSGWVLGDLLIGNGSNSVARLAAPTTPDAVTEILVNTPSGGATQPAWALAGLAGRVVSGTTDTIVAADRTPQTIEYQSNSATAITVPDPASTGFNGNPSFVTIAEGAGPYTFTPQTSAVITYCDGSNCFAGQPSLTLQKGQYATWSSPTTSNWFVRVASTQPISQPPIVNGLISGGGVTWTGLLNFTCSAAQYAIGGTVYNSPQTNLTLSAADPTNPRIDVIAVDNTGACVKITGTPAGSPAAPSVDPTTQLSLTFVTIAANATTPTLNSILVYDENSTPPTEYTCTPTANFNCNSTNNPFHLTHDIEATTAVATNSVSLVNSGTVNFSTYSTLSFNIRNKANWPSAKSLQICFLNSATIVGNCVGFKNGVYGFNQTNITSYQQIVIPLSAFALGTTVADRVRFQVIGTGGSIGFYLDWIQIQSTLSGSGASTFQLQVNGQNTQPTTNLADNASVTWACTVAAGTTVSTCKATAVGAPPSGTAGGDLSGTYPNPTVAQVNGAAVPTSANVLGSNGSNQLVAAKRTAIDAITYAAGGGTANAQTVTLAPAITGLTNGLQVCWKPSNANASTTPTLAVNGLTATTIIKVGGAALAASDLTTTAVACAIYDGSNFELQNPQTTSGGVTSLTGDGSGYSNSASTGAVTLTKASQNPNIVAAGPISSSVSNLVQKTTASSSVSGPTLAYSTTPATGDLLIAVTVNNVGHVNTLTGGGNTWVHGVTGTTGSLVTDIWYTCNASGSATTVTPTWPGGAVAFILDIYEYAGNTTSNCLDTTGVAGSNTPGVSTQSVTTGGSVAQATELVFAPCTVLFSGATTLTVPPTYSTLINTTIGNSTELDAQLNASTGLSGTQTITCTAGVSNPAFLGALIATFKLNSSGSSPWTFRSLVNGDLPAHTPATLYANTNTAQTSAISDTVMTTVGSSQLFRFTGEVNCTTQVNTATATLNLKWTDTSNTAQTLSITGTCTTLGASSVADMVHGIRAITGSNITYGVTIANSPHFDVDVRLEQMN